MKSQMKIFDPSEGGYINIPIAMVSTPTAEQVIKCKDSKGYAADSCGRVVINAGS